MCSRLVTATRCLFRTSQYFFITDCFLRMREKFPNINKSLGFPIFIYRKGSAWFPCDKVNNFGGYSELEQYFRKLSSYQRIFAGVYTVKLISCRTNAFSICSCLTKFLCACSCYVTNPYLSSDEWSAYIRLPLSKQKCMICSEYFVAEL